MPPPRTVSPSSSYEDRRGAAQRRGPHSLWSRVKWAGIVCPGFRASTKTRGWRHRIPRFNQPSLFKSAGRDTTTVRSATSTIAVGHPGEHVVLSSSRVGFQPTCSPVPPVPPVQFQWRVLRFGATWSRDCSFDVSYIDRAAALITIREDCSNFVLSSRVSCSPTAGTFDGKLRLRRKPCGASSAASWLADSLVRWANLLRSLRSLTLAFFRSSWIPGHLYRWLIPPVTLGASLACPDRPHFDPVGSDWTRWVRASPSSSFPPALTTGYFYR